MIFRKAEKEDFYKIRSLYWNLIDQEQNDLSFPHLKKGIHPSGEMIQNSIDTGQLYPYKELASQSDFDRLAILMSLTYNNNKENIYF